MDRGVQFRLPKINPGAHGESRGPDLPGRDIAPPLPVRSPTLQRGPSSIRQMPRQGQSEPRYHGSPTIPVGKATTEPCRRPALLKLDRNHVDPLVLQSSTIAKLVVSRQLPLTVELRERNSCKGCSVVLEKGSCLVFHFLYKTQRIYATDNNDVSYYLPIHAIQLYTVLPIDPVHDDTIYPNTLALINARPLPRRVRIEEAHFSDHPGEAQECGDIIEIEGVEKRPVPMGSDDPSQKCLIGTCNNVPIAFSESMDCATYSTMPSIDFLSLSEIVKKFPLPLRVRKADDPAFVMNLHRLDDEYHVVATSANLNQVLSIPVTWDGKVELLQNEPLEKLFQSLLPPLYPLVNTTWGLKEPGRRDLQANMQLVAQPLPEILESWSRTKEGQAFVLNATKTAVDMHKMRIEELMEEKTRLNNELKIYRTSAPAPPPRKDVKTTRPAVPPRPSPTSPKGSPFGRSSVGGDNSDDGEYEEPLPVVNKGSSHVKSSGKALHELKELLQTREAEKKVLQEKVKRMEGENRVLEGKNACLVEQIRGLQLQLDKAEADPMYDSLDEGTSYLNEKSGPVYGDSRSLQSNTLKNYDEGAVGNLLREMRLEAYVDKFKENCINGELLAELDEEDLYGEIGMGRIHAKRLLIEVKKRSK